MEKIVLKPLRKHVLFNTTNNCYLILSDPFVQRGNRLKSLEGATQGDPAALAIYNLGIVPLVAWLSRWAKEKREKFPSGRVAFVDDLNGVGSLENFKKSWATLKQEARKFGYHVKASKSYITVKKKYQYKEN